MKSTPRIFVEDDGIGMEGLRTAVAAVAASPVLCLSPVFPLTEFSMGEETPFATVLADIVVDVAKKVFDSEQRSSLKFAVRWKVVTWSCLRNSCDAR